MQGLQGSQIFIQILWLGSLACSRLFQSRGWVRNLIFGGTSSNDYFKFQRSKTFFTFLTRPEPVTSVAANTWGQYISIMVVWRNICEFGYTLFWKRYEGGYKGWKERVCTKHNLLLLRHGPIDSLPTTPAQSLEEQQMDIHKNHWGHFRPLIR